MAECGSRAEDAEFEKRVIPGPGVHDGAAGNNHHTSSAAYAPSQPALAEARVRVLLKICGFNLLATAKQHLTPLAGNATQAQARVVLRLYRFAHERHATASATKQDCFLGGHLCNRAD
jgi:hypothetical protein